MSIIFGSYGRFVIIFVFVFV
jgi:pyruvate dehydrogenase E1 component beta subunit